jgi:hypothetical protein
VPSSPAGSVKAINLPGYLQNNRGNASGGSRLDHFVHTTLVVTFQECGVLPHHFRDLLICERSDRRLFDWGSSLHWCGRGRYRGRFNFWLDCRGRLNRIVKVNVLNL